MALQAARGRLTGGQMIRRAREAAGLSQAALARATELTDQAISNIELDRATPRLETLARIADALHVPWEPIARAYVTSTNRCFSQTPFEQAEPISHFPPQVQQRHATGKVLALA